MSLLKGLRYLYNAHELATVDCQGWLGRGNWNLAARRAYESLELTVKAVHFLLEKKPPKTHDAGLPSELDQVPVVAWHTSENPQDGPSIIVQKPLRERQSHRVFKIARGAMILLAERPLGPEAVSNLHLLIDGSSIHVICDGVKIESLTDTAHGASLQGKWIQVHLTQPELLRIKNAMKKVKKGRNDAFYLDTEFSKSDSESLSHTALSVFTDVKRHAGYNLEGLRH